MNRRRKWKPRPNEIKVPSRSKLQILNVVQLLHNGFNLEKPICLETLLNLLANEEILEYEVVEDELLGHNYAVTNRDYITIKQSVFDPRKSYLPKKKHVLWINSRHFGLARSPKVAPSLACSRYSLA